MFNLNIFSKITSFIFYSKKMDYTQKLIWDSIRFWRKTMKKNFRFRVLALIIILSLSIINELIIKIPEFMSVPTTIIIITSISTLIIYYIIKLIIAIGTINLALKFIHKKQWKIIHIFQERRTIWRFALWQIILTISIIIWMLLFIIPWIRIAIRLSFMPYLIVDKKYDPKEAIKTSRNMTRHKIRLIIRFNLLAFVINLAGLISLFLWLFATIPTTMIAQANFYDKLLKEYEHSQKSTKAEKIEEEKK